MSSTLISKALQKWQYVTTRISEQKKGVRVLAKDDKKKRRPNKISYKEEIGEMLQAVTPSYDGRSDMKSKYTEMQIIHAVALYKVLNNMEEVSRITGIPAPTVWGWVKGTTNVLAKTGNAQKRIEEEYKLLQDGMVTVMREAQMQILRKLPEASAAQAATIFGINFDKFQISQGNAPQGQTLIVNVDSMGKDEQNELLSRVLKRNSDDKKATDPEPIEVEAKVEE